MTKETDCGAQPGKGPPPDPGSLTQIRSRIATLQQERRARHDLNQLIELNERMLHDLSVTRDEIHRAANRPVGLDTGELIRQGAWRSA